MFLREDQDLGIRPEKLISALGGEHEFIRRHQCAVRSIAAFEKSEDTDDWRDLMRLYMVRRTRGFIVQHYAREDERGKYLQFSGGEKSYFPKRSPKSLAFKIDDTDPADPYARFYSDEVAKAINSLVLPRYGLGNYLATKPKSPPTLHQTRIIDGLSRAGTRLMGFCRTNLFKRLESAGPAFLLSLERHILRNFIVLHAIENDLDIPLGTQGAELLDTRYHDEDAEDAMADEAVETDNGEDIINDPEVTASASSGMRAESDYRGRAKTVYAAYSGPFRNRFKWLPNGLFVKSLAKDLLADAQALIAVLNSFGEWQPDQDAKLEELAKLIQSRHAKDKVLVLRSSRTRPAISRNNWTHGASSRWNSQQAKVPTPPSWPGVSPPSRTTSGTRWGQRTNYGCSLRPMCYPKAKTFRTAPSSSITISHGPLSA